MCGRLDDTSLEKLGCIYLVTCLDNGKTYIGQYAYENPHGRYARHWAPNQKDTCVFHRALWKYGKGSFKLETLGVFPRSSLNNMEAYYAEQFQSYIWDTNEDAHIPGGYNMMVCGQMNRQGMKHTPEALAKMAAASTGRVKSAETRAKIGASQKGKKMSAEAIEKHRQAMIGRKPSSEARAKMSAARKGRVLSDQTKRKMSESKKGWIPSEETRAKWSAIRTGKKLTPEQLVARKSRPPTEKQLAQRKKMHEDNVGRTQTEEARQKIREAQLRRWQKWHDDKLKTKDY